MALSECMRPTNILYVNSSLEKVESFVEWTSQAYSLRVPSSGVQLRGTSLITVRRLTYLYFGRAQIGPSTLKKQKKKTGALYDYLAGRAAFCFSA